MEQQFGTYIPVLPFPKHCKVCIFKYLIEDDDLVRCNLLDRKPIHIEKDIGRPIICPLIPVPIYNDREHPSRDSYNKEFWANYYKDLQRKTGVDFSWLYTSED